MNRVLILTLVIFTILGFTNSHADSLVQFPTGDAEWTVEVKANGPATGRQVINARVTQLGGKKRVILNWSDGKVTQKWTLTTLPVIFEEDPRNNFVTPFAQGSRRNALVNFALTYDSFAFEWITPAALQEKDPISYQEKKCFHYKGNAAIAATAGTNQGPTTSLREAWIDSQTRLPVALDNGQSLSTFQFSLKPPEGPLTMPPNVVREIRYYCLTMGYPPHEISK